MSVLRGPNRMVLIRSGGYDYAELQLHAPVHLVADNNVGKTTLIAALQFLYIDDPQKMHFSHSWSETRQHYFPETHSLMLFEVWTPTGPQVVGFRGLGPVQGFRYERLIYAGEYKRTDFIDGLRVLPWMLAITRKRVYSVNSAPGRERSMVPGRHGDQNGVSSAGWIGGGAGLAMSAPRAISRASSSVRISAR